MRKPHLPLSALAVLFVALTSGGCSSASSDPTPGPIKSVDPTELRIALVPSDDAEEMINQFEKLRAYLEKSLGMKVKVSKVTSYAACIEAMKKGRIDLAWYGPTSYVLAEQEANAEAFLVPADSKGVASYYSEILVPANSPAKTIVDLKGKKFGLVEASSTSGGLIPSYLVFEKTGERIEKFVDVSYLGNHDAVVNAVRQGAIDAGGTNNLTVERLLEEGKLKPTEYKVLDKSDPLPQSPLSWRKGLTDQLKQKIKTAFMESPKELGTYKIAGFGEIAGYKEVGPKDYQLIRDIASKLGLTRDQLLK